jgi:hypothetical protein
MKEEELINLLRSITPKSTATEIACCLAMYLGKEFGQFTLIVAFKKAFPLIPIPVLTEASVWFRSCLEGADDGEFNRLLSPWIEKSREQM